MDIPKGLINQLESNIKGIYENVTEEDLVRGILEILNSK